MSPELLVLLYGLVKCLLDNITNIVVAYINSDRKNKEYDIFIIR